MSEPIAQPVSQAEGGIWDSIREALRGSHRDYTEGSVSRSILILAIPMVLEMIMESVFAVCDVFFVSKLGANAVATVGLTESWLTLIYALAMGLAISASAIVARRIGEKDREGAAQAAGQAILLSVGVSAALGLAGILLAPKLLGVMGASPDVIASGANYTRVMLGGSMTIVMLFMINAIFRGAGDAAIAMRVLWLANAINILLGPCLIFGLGPFPELGVTGAAVATTIGRGIGALFALSRLLKPGSRIDIHQRHLRLDLGLIKRIVQMGWSATLQMLIGMCSWIALIRVLSTFGSNVLAGYTIGIRVIIFALLPAFGVANAAATMVGQALGAKKPERAEEAVKIAGTYSTIVLTAVGAVLAIFAPFITGLFTHDPLITPTATNVLRIVACGFPFYAWGMVVSQSFNGAGDTRTPTLLNLFVFWLWEIPLAYVLAKVVGVGPAGIFVAIAIAFSTYAVAGTAVFRRGTWKERRV
ncbi:MAG TPA: MATE family efflux transporter [Gemmatimonadaceae bacterium]